jgi:hypothetical protein
MRSYYKNEGMSAGGPTAAGARDGGKEKKESPTSYYKVYIEKSRVDGCRWTYSSRCKGWGTSWLLWKLPCRPVTTRLAVSNRSWPL